jgi:dienelactone hydrolase
MSSITIEQITLGDVPVLLFLPEGAKKSPVVFYIHGYFSSKETGGEIGLKLAQQGIACIAPDAPDHGQRPRDRIDRLFQPGSQLVYPPDSGLDVYTLMLDHIVEMAAGIEEMTAALSSDPRLDMGRVGITGLSFGGMVAFQAAATVPHIQVAVPMISMPTSVERWEDLLAEASSYSQWAGAMAAAQPESKQRAAWLREHNALDRLKNFAPKPLLILCGDRDTDMPKVYAVHALRAIQPAYADAPDRLKMTIYDGVAHTVPAAMMGDMIAWFQTYL